MIPLTQGLCGLQMLQYLFLGRTRGRKPYRTVHNAQTALPDWVWLAFNVLPSWNTALEGNHLFIDAVSINDWGYYAVYVGKLTWLFLVACCSKVCENRQESFLSHYVSNAVSDNSFANTFEDVGNSSYPLEYKYLYISAFQLG